MQSQGLFWLLIDDSDDDSFLTRRACLRLQPQPTLARVRDGVEAQSYLLGTGPFGDRVKFPFPVLIVCDLKMPRMNGLEFLRWFRGHEACRSIPFWLLTSSAAQSDREAARQLGAAGFLIKPGAFAELVAHLQAVLDKYHPR